MPVVDIPFTRSSMPGQRPGEGMGRNLNALCEMDGETPTWRPVPGMAQFSDTGFDTPRGAIEVNSILYAARKDKLVSILGTGVATAVGDLPGSDLVTFSRNSRPGTPDVLVVTATDIYRVTSSGVVALNDPNLPQPNSISSLDSYFIASIGDGRMFASAENDVSFGALSFATCQSSPDGLLRGTVSGQLWYGWGSKSIEVWQDVGDTPFPLSRQTVIPIGLIAPNAVAGFEPGWALQQIFVASDGTVRRLDGVDPGRISTKDVERAIAAVADKTTLVASVYVSAGHQIWSLTSPFWTWEYNASTGFWHERASRDRPNWRGVTATLFGDKWLVGDALSTGLYEISEQVFTEAGEVIHMTLESGPAKQFPSRLRVMNGFFDWTVGQGEIVGVDDVTMPEVQVSWSHDGGATYGNALLRSLGGQGEFRKQIRVDRCGVTTHHGMRWRLVSSSPVYRTLRGGRMNVAEVRP